MSVKFGTYFNVIHRRDCNIFTLAEDIAWRLLPKLGEEILWLDIPADSMDNNDFWPKYCTQIIFGYID